MRVQVILDENGTKAESKIIETLFTEEAMRAHGESVLRKEMFDRNILELSHLVDDTFKAPGDTVKVVEHEYDKTHWGIITGFSFMVTSDSVDMTYTAEVIYEQ